jgi:hypothetical protein
MYLCLGGQVDKRSGADNGIVDGGENRSLLHLRFKCQPSEYCDRRSACSPCLFGWAKSLKLDITLYLNRSPAIEMKANRNLKMKRYHYSDTSCLFRVVCIGS